MKRALTLFGLIALLLLAFFINARADVLEVEDVGPDRDAPGVQQRREFENEGVVGKREIEDKALSRMDSDGDGVNDDRDECPDTPSLIGTYNIGEWFSLEDVEFRYVLDGDVDVIRTTNIPDSEGGDQVCRPNGSKCTIEGTPEIEIIVLERMNNRIRIRAVHVVDDTGCSPIP